MKQIFLFTFTLSLSLFASETNVSEGVDLSFEAGFQKSSDQELSAYVNRKEFQSVFSHLQKQLDQKNKQIELLQNQVLELSGLESMKEDIEVNSSEIETLDQRLDQGVRISGYFDAKYVDRKTKNTLLHDSFDQHHTALFFQAKKDDFEFFAEMEWEHSGRGVKQERGWIRYAPKKRDDFSVKVGQFFVPTYWNLNHYPTTTISITSPDLVRTLMPWDFTGVLVAKDFRTRNGNFSWQGYAGNGFDEDPLNPGLDADDSKAVGQKLGWSQLGRKYRLRLDWLHYIDRRGKDISGRALTFRGDYDADLFELGLKWKRWDLNASYGFSSQDDLAVSQKVRSKTWYAQPSYAMTHKLTGFVRFGDMDADKDRFTASDRSQRVYGFNYKPGTWTRLKLEYVEEKYDLGNLADEREIWSAFSLSF